MVSISYFTILRSSQRVSSLHPLIRRYTNLNWDRTSNRICPPSGSARMKSYAPPALFLIPKSALRHLYFHKTYSSASRAGSKPGSDINVPSTIGFSIISISSNSKRARFSYHNSQRRSSGKATNRQRLTDFYLYSSQSRVGVRVREYWRGGLLPALGTGIQTFWQGLQYQRCKYDDFQLWRRWNG